MKLVLAILEGVAAVIRSIGIRWHFERLVDQELGALMRQHGWTFSVLSTDEVAYRSRLYSMWISYGVDGPNYLAVKVMGGGDQRPATPRVLQSLVGTTDLPTAVPLGISYAISGIKDEWPVVVLDGACRTRAEARHFLRRIASELRLVGGPIFRGEPSALDRGRLLYERRREEYFLDMMMKMAPAELAEQWRGKPYSEVKPLYEKWGLEVYGDIDRRPAGETAD